MSELPTPHDREEIILNAMASGQAIQCPEPRTRKEIYLKEIYENGGGSGGGGVTPAQVEELIAAHTDSSLSDTSTNPVQNKVVKAAIDACVKSEEGKVLVDTSDVTQIATNKQAIETLTGAGEGSVSKAVSDATVNKVDKVSGKSLIADTEITRLKDVHNYDDTDLSQAVSDLSDSVLSLSTSKVDKVAGKDLSTNDLTNALKASYDQAVTDTKSLELAETELKVLGWTVPSEMSVENTISSDGVFHQKVGRVDLGSLSWTYDTSKNNTFYTKLLTMKNDNSALICYGYNQHNVSAANMVNKDISSYGTSMLNEIRIKDLTYADATTFKNAMQGKYLYYELANEISISIDGNEVVEKVNDLMYSDVAGGKNLFDINKATIVSDAVLNGEVISNVKTDTKTNFNPTIQAYNGETYISAPDSTVVNSVGNAVLHVVVPANTTRLRLKHNGSQSDIGLFSYNTAENSIKAGDILTISFYCSSVNASIKNGISIKNIQIEKSTNNSPYEPYIPSIKTLSDKTNDLSEQIKTGAFRVAVTANTVLTVSSATILSGTLPPDFNRAYFKPISHSNSIDYDLKMTTDNGVLRLKPSKDNNISIIWTWFKNQIISV